MNKINTSVTNDIPTIFNTENYHQLCQHLAGIDHDLKTILDTYSYPPMWTRENTCETLVHIILEQQVSLASALAALNKLRERTIQITPEAILGLIDEEMRACFVSWQKTVYIRGLAQAIKGDEINLTMLEQLPLSAVFYGCIVAGHVLCVSMC